MSEVPWSEGGVYSLKYIPSAEENGNPIRELILTPGEFTAHEGKFFGGRASVKFERSEIDPTYMLEPKKICKGFYGKGDLFLPFGKVVFDYK
jgi:hypothetical protein